MKNEQDSKPPVIPPLPPAHGSAISFRIGEKTYWVGRDSRRNGYRIVANGDTVDYASALHYGDVGAFQQIVDRLATIERDWVYSQHNAAGEPPVR